MRLVRPTAGATPGEGTRKGSGGGSRTLGKPQWLKEWIANRGNFVELECGHRDNLNDRALIVFNKLGNCHVFCESCNDFFPVVRQLKFNEYAGITPAVIPNEPLF